MYIFFQMTTLKLNLKLNKQKNQFVFEKFVESRNILSNHGF